MRLRLLATLLLLGCNLLSSAQLHAWKNTYDTNEPQNNDTVCESMASVPGGDVIVASITGTPSSMALRVRRLGFDGTSTWETTVANPTFTDPLGLVVAGPYVHVFSYWGWYVLNLQNGAQIVQHDRPSNWRMVAPHPSGDIFTVEASELVRIDATTAAVEWSRWLERLSAIHFVKSDALGNAYAGGSYYDPNTFVVNGLGVSKYDETGQSAWTAAAGNQDFPPVPDEPADVVVDTAANALYVTAAQNYNSYDDDFSITKFNLTSGEMVWNRMLDSGGYNEAGKALRKLSDGSIVGLGTDGKVVCLSPANVLKWTANAGYDPYGLEVGANDVVYVGTFSYGGRPDYALIALDPSSGLRIADFRYDQGGLEVATGLAIAADGNPIVNGSVRAGGFRQVCAVKFQLAQLILTPSQVYGGNPCGAQIQLAGVAPPGGYTLALGATDPSITTSAPSVSIPAGSSIASFTVNSVPVTSSLSTSVYFARSGPTSTELGAAGLKVLPPVLSAIAVNPSNVTGGLSVNGSVTLAGPAPAGGAVVVISDNSPYVTTFANCFVPAGHRTAGFGIVTVPVASQAWTIVTGTYMGVAKTANLGVKPAALTAVGGATSLISGVPGTGTVYLSGNAATGGAAVSLTDNSASVTVPASVLVTEGAKTAAFSVTSPSVAAAQTVVVTATRSGVSKTWTFTLRPPVIANFSIVPDGLQGGQSTTGLITLSSPAPAGGYTVTLQTGAPSIVTIPPSVFMPAGSTTRAFVIATKPVTQPYQIGIYATLNGATKAKLIYIFP